MYISNYFDWCFELKQHGLIEKYIPSHLTDSFYFRLTHFYILSIFLAG